MKPSHIVASLTLLELAAALVSATTFAPASDSHLADQAAAVARVKVIAAGPGTVNRTPVTDALVVVEDHIAGSVSGTTIVVRLPGGELPPQLTPGDEALLFLAGGVDTNSDLVHPVLGSFQIRLSGGVWVAEQQPSALASGTSSEPTAERDLGRFTSWLADRAHGLTRSPDYWITPCSDPTSRRRKPLSVLEPAHTGPTRWISFDSGKEVTWRVNSLGQPEFSQVQSVAKIQAALVAWMDDHSPSLDCTSGCFVAIDGSYYYTSSRLFRSQHQESFEAHVVTNDGTNCSSPKSPAGTAEVLAHKPRHNLCFGHTTPVGSSNELRMQRPK